MIKDRIRYQILRKKPDPKGLVFVIGLSKTATTSISEALQILGYNSIHYAPMIKLKSNNVSFHWPWWLGKYQAFSDLPVAWSYKHLMKIFSSSTFILTTREKDSWLESCKTHFNEERYHNAVKNPEWKVNLALNKEVYGSNIFDKDKFSNAYDQNLNNVTRDFKNKDNFFKIDICSGEGWDQLCKILQKDTPLAPFPKSNTKAMNTQLAASV